MTHSRNCSLSKSCLGWRSDAAISSEGPAIAHSRVFATKPAEGKAVTGVEGFFDCLRVYEAGLPCVVALMGCSLSLRQEELPCERFQEVSLFLDGDSAGRTAGAAIAQRLVSKVSTRLIEVPAGSQPDQLGADQIRCLCIPGYF